MTDDRTAPERAVQEARRSIYELLTPLPAWTADVVRDELRRLERAVEARTREQVAQEIETFRARSQAARQFHEAAATFGLPIPSGTPVTCPFCNGDEQPMKEQR